jgi:nicotinamide-nucleotide amidase
MSELSSLIQALANQLQARHLSLATAESCTGGLVAKLCTDLPGSSAWFDCGFISYSNASKQRLLGVAAATLNQYGAVSEAVVREMANGALHQSDAQVSLAISGIAGPGGGSTEKPVGLVCFAWALPNQAVISQTQFFQGERDSIRQQAAYYACKRLLTDLI